MRMLSVSAWNGWATGVGSSSANTVLVLREPLPGTPAADRFSEARIGLDHVAFNVETRSELEELSERLRGLGAEVGEPEHDPHGGGAALTFRDPDNIQLEFYLPP